MGNQSFVYTLYLLKYEPIFSTSIEASGAVSNETTDSSL